MGSSTPNICRSYGCDNLASVAGMLCARCAEHYRRGGNLKRVIEALRTEEEIAQFDYARQALSKYDTQEVRTVRDE